MAKRLTQTFSIGFAIVWGWVLFNSVLRWQHNGPAALLAGFALGFVAFFAARYLLPGWPLSCCFIPSYWG